MGNCFTKTYEIPITSGTIERPPTFTQQPAATANRGKPPRPPSTSRRPTFPKPSSGRPPLPSLLPGSMSRKPSRAAIGPVLQRPMADVRSQYNLERKLGSGQFGTTYLCTEHATGLKYACKSVSKRKLVRRADVEDMRREVTILQHLSGQPNIAEFRGAFEDTDSVHLVMEFCSGGELFDRITAKGNYSERQAAAVCRDVLTVVHVCHFMGVIHRDLKPENFLLASPADDAPLKAIDFGLSIFIEEGKVYKDIVGSAYYVAPEVLHRNYGKEIDVWSAGVILYILLCGSPPFWAETEKGIFDAILVGQLDFSSSPWPTISESGERSYQTNAKQRSPEAYYCSTGPRTSMAQGWCI
ncbi:hypothetical protein ACQ4PT_032166 [Festuca glaucescens]